MFKIKSKKLVMKVEKKTVVMVVIGIMIGLSVFWGANLIQDDIDEERRWEEHYQQLKEETKKSQEAKLAKIRSGNIYIEPPGSVGRFDKGEATVTLIDTKVQVIGENDATYTGIDDYPDKAVVVGVYVRDKDGDIKVLNEDELKRFEIDKSPLYATPENLTIKVGDKIMVY